MNPFKGRHFQRDIILWAVRWYCKYGISYRELQVHASLAVLGLDFVLTALMFGN